MSTTNTVRAAANAVDVSAVPKRVKLLSWGDNKRFDGGVQILNETNAEAIVAEFRRRGVDLVIDWDHGTVPGNNQRADGKAPAAGWIKTMEVVNGIGLFGTVEWVNDAAEMIAAKQYRYLSPVTIRRVVDDIIVDIDSVALTNKPAINGFDALVNSIRAEPKETDMTEIAQLLGLAPEATAEEIMAKIKALMEAQASSANAAAKLKAVGEELKVAVDGDVEAVLNSVRGAIKSATPSTDPIRDKAVAELQTANSRIATLESKLADQEWNAFLATNNNRDKVSPDEEPELRKYWDTNRQGAEKLINAMTAKVKTRETAPHRDRLEAGPTSDRATVINSAKTRFRADPDLAWGGRTEREFVAGELASAGQKALTADEATKFAIVG